MVGKYHSALEPSAVETNPWPLTGRNGETWALQVRRELLEGKREVYTLNQIGKADLFVAFTHSTFDETESFPRRQQLLAAAIFERRAEFAVALVGIARKMFNQEEQRKLLYDRTSGGDKIIDLALECGMLPVQRAFAEWESDFGFGGKFERRR
jgi:hypothetical protein